MTKKQLIDRLNEIADRVDRERLGNGAKHKYDEADGHVDADQALLDFISDSDVTAAYHRFSHWYE